jgi:glycosyltransferase involved in cell wall biosynthesis
VQSLLLVKDRYRLRSELAGFARLGVSDHMRVSVPIATYDRIDILIDRTIPALLGQTHQDVEVIVVGDGSDPGHFRRLEALDDARIRTVLLPRRTRYPSDPVERWMVAGWKARNVGASLATGGWLLWMSDDDIILPHGIETLLRIAQDRPDADVVSAGFESHSRPPVTHLPSNAVTGLPFAIAGMPALLARVYTRAFRWSGHSHLKAWHRPSDYDLLMRMHRSGLVFAAADEVVAIVPEVPGTGAVGSRAFVEEESERIRRRKDSDRPE